MPGWVGWGREVVGGGRYRVSGVGGGAVLDGVLDPDTSYNHQDSEVRWLVGNSHQIWPERGQDQHAQKRSLEVTPLGPSLVAHPKHTETLRERSSTVIKAF